MARNRQRGQGASGRRKAQQGGDPARGRPERAPSPGPARRHGGDPIVDDVLDELEREGVVAADAESPTPPPLSESERLRAGARRPTSAAPPRCSTSSRTSTRSTIHTTSIRFRGHPRGGPRPRDGKTRRRPLGDAQGPAASRAVPASPYGPSCSACSGRTAVRSLPGDGRRPRLRDHRRRLPRPARLGRTASRPSSSSSPQAGYLRKQSDQVNVSLVRRQHLFRAREQGQAEPRAPRHLPGPAARRAPGRRPDRDRVRR